MSPEEEIDKLPQQENPEFVNMQCEPWKPLLKPTTVIEKLSEEKIAVC